jgi:predicted nucleic acid-binding protein
VAGVTLALDASALIAHLDATDGHHHRATEILLAAVGERFLAHPLTLADCLVVPVRAGRESEVTAALDYLRLETTPVDRASPLRLARLRVATGLRMPDCCALDVARQYEATLVTFDDRQRTAASTMGVPATDADPR